MRHVRLRTLIFGLAVAAVGIAGALAVATSGRAASGNICNTPSTGTAPNLTASSCVKQFVLPHYVNAGASALSVTKFTNESGSGGATATHLVIAVSFATRAASITTIQLSVGTTKLDSSVCTSSVNGVSCPAGNIPGGTTVKLVVQFVANGGGRLTGSAAYGEGPGNPSNPPNDFQVNYDTLNVVGDTTVQGGCFGATFNLLGTTSKQSTSAAGGQGNDGFPCTFADAGVFLTVPAGFHTFVSFVEFPVMLNGPAKVVLQFTPLPAPLNWKTFPLYENTATGPTVQPCNASGLPTNGLDSCTTNRSTLPKGGAEVDMNVVGATFDGSYWG